jgi:hypothetical protein
VSILQTHLSEVRLLFFIFFIFLLFQNIFEQAIRNTSTAPFVFNYFVESNCFLEFLFSLWVLFFSEQ